MSHTCVLYESRMSQGYNVLIRMIYHPLMGSDKDQKQGEWSTSHGDDLIRIRDDLIGINDDPIRDQVQV